MPKFSVERPRKLTVIADTSRREHALRLIPGVPLRIHASNGGYLFSLFTDGNGNTVRYNDKRWGDRRLILAKRITWEQPV